MEIGVWQEVAVNVVANLIAAAVCGLMILLTLVVSLLLRRKKLFRLFGVDSEDPYVQIYVSRIQLRERGTEGHEPLNAGSTGVAINALEYKGAIMICNLLKGRLTPILYRSIRDIVDGNYGGLYSINATIDPSPRNIDEGAHGTIVAIGGSVYNAVTKRYLSHPSSFFSFSRDADNGVILKIRRGGLSGIQEIPGRGVGKELGIIQKFGDEGLTVIVCAGLGAAATFGSARYLAENWRQLHKKYRRNEFAICLEFPGQDRENEPVVYPRVVCEYGTLGD